MLASTWTSRENCVFPLWLFIGFFPVIGLYIILIGSSPLHGGIKIKPSLLLSVFFPRGVTPTSKFVCVLPFPDGDARRHRDLSWFGQEKALRPSGERVYIILHLSACTGANTNVEWSVELYYVWVWSCVVMPVLFLSLSFYSSKERPRVHA